MGPPRRRVSTSPPRRPATPSGPSATGPGCGGSTPRSAAPAGVLVTGVPDPWDGSTPTPRSPWRSTRRTRPGWAGWNRVRRHGAALFLGAVTSPAPGTFRYPAAATSHVGDGVHADVLAIRFTDDGSQVWVATDGGVFVSTQGGAAGTFVGRNGGMAVIEAGFVASHPANDTAVILGAQDNGAQRRVGESLWRNEAGGDGGGVAFDLATPYRYVAQYTHSDWSNGPTTPPAPVRRGPEANWRTRTRRPSSTRSRRRSSTVRVNAAGGRHQPGLVHAGLGHELGDAAHPQRPARRCARRPPGCHRRGPRRTSGCCGGRRSTGCG